MGHPLTDTEVVSDALIARLAPRASASTIQSALVLDLSRESQRAHLLERINGAFRFVAKSEVRNDPRRDGSGDPERWPQLLTALE